MHWKEVVRLSMPRLHLSPFLNGACRGQSVAVGSVGSWATWAPVATMRPRQTMTAYLAFYGVAALNPPGFETAGA